MEYGNNNPDAHDLFYFYNKIMNTSLVPSHLPPIYNYNTFSGTGRARGCCFTTEVRTSFTIRGVSGFRYAAALTASRLQSRSIHESFTQSLDVRRSSILKEDVSPSPAATESVSKFDLKTRSEAPSHLQYHIGEVKRERNRLKGNKLGSWCST